MMEQFKQPLTRGFHLVVALFLGGLQIRYLLCFPVRVLGDFPKQRD
jgi:hypothetical protein